MSGGTQLCARCGRRLRRRRWVYSRATRAHYCLERDGEACARRAKRRARQT